MAERHVGGREGPEARKVIRLLFLGFGIWDSWEGVGNFRIRDQ